ncbi:unnamed protein product [Periconia digitata]|uniref:Uncharacterized protein n=1 Tax=Periconia digitata TaxID=1303443 RepID=A0A9W4XRA7_9PLEO|nr:unnamed protein product [Periconia digitata]
MGRAAARALASPSDQLYTRPSTPPFETMSTSPDPTKLSPVPPKAPSPRSPPAAHFEDSLSPTHQADDTQQVAEAALGDDDEIPYPEPGSEHTLLPPPNFNPFFAIIEDFTTGEHHHPFVHYVFADDDPAIITAAAMRSMGLDDTKFLPSSEGAEGDNHEGEEGEEHEPVVESPLPPPLIRGKEHYLLIDVGSDGHSIVNAQSMSSDWQITKANVRTAPSFDQSESNQGYMLQIEGQEIPRKNKGKAKGQPGERKLNEAREKSTGDPFEALDSLAASVDEGLGVAEKISRRHEAVKESGQTVTQSEEVQGSRRNSQLVP